jgi:CheY-like chemotaxis protein
MLQKVLVIDDSRFQIQVLRMALEKRGFEVLAALDTAQAGIFARHHIPQAIVLDINMPGGSGIDVLKRLKRSTKTQNIPVIVVSGNEDPDIKNVALQLGAKLFLAKPVDTEQLCAAITRLLALAATSKPDVQS